MGKPPPSRMDGGFTLYLWDLRGHYASVEVVLGLLHAVLQDARGRLDGPFKGLQQCLAVRLGGHADDPVDHVTPLTGGAGW